MLLRINNIHFSIEKKISFSRQKFKLLLTENVSLCSGVSILLVLYVQQVASQIVNRDFGIIFDFYGEKNMLFLPNNA